MFFFHSNLFSFVGDLYREDCEIVQSMCPDWAQLVNRFLDPLPDKIRSLGLSSCENLPENDCTTLWPISKYIHTGFFIKLNPFVNHVLEENRLL